MSIIHRTTMSPTKLELLADWLPTRSWYAGSSPAPEKAGGFRLDDPAGEVGIEFMAVRDGSGPDAPVHHVPLAYRGAPLDGAEDGLIGTTEHGVLGRRWIYDGTHDPVLLAQVLAFVLGRVPAHAQSVSDALDPTVHAHWEGPALTTGTDDIPAQPVLLSVTDTAHTTDTVLRLAPEPGAAAQELTLRFHRLLSTATDTGTPADGTSDATAPALHGHLTANWQLPDGSTRRGRYAEVRG